LAHEGVMATRPATAPDAAPTEVGLPSLSFSTTTQPMIAAAVAPSVLMMMRPTDESSVPRRPNVPSAGVEAEPAEPQDRGAEHHERHVVRLVDALLEADALAEHQGEREAAAPALMCTAVPPA
jgi:hypothetical protein